MTEIAVLLTVHNRKEKTEECLYRLYQCELPNDVMLVTYLTDDGCTDGTADMLAEKYPQVKVVQGDGNLFWNRGMHKAWQRAVEERDFDFYLWLNDDTYLYKETIKNMLADAAEKNNEAIITGATRSADTGKTTYGLRNPKTEEPITPNGTLQTGTGLNGNCVLVPRKVYQQLGNLDPYFHHAAGDTDYGLRAQEQGIDVLLAKNYVGECEWHPTLSTWCNPDYSLRERWKSLNKPTGMPLKQLFYLERKHYGLPRALFHLCTTVAHCCFPKLWLKLDL